MTQRILVFSRDSELIGDLHRQLDPQHSLDAVHSMDELREQLDVNHVSAVFVHLGPGVLNGHTPGRFVAELNDVVDKAPLFGLLDPKCPVRLEQLAGRAINEWIKLPVDQKRLSEMLLVGRDLEQTLDELWTHRVHRELHGRTRSLVTFTPVMFDMLEEIKVAARHNVTSLLIGETGCGKTFLARLIHELSPRRDEPFLTVACGALPPDLIESELFGSVKGAFTGADRTREGKFAAAGRGTLLLDEIDVLPPDQQAKLLRVIETGEYEQVGSNDTQRSEARLIVASNYNLEDLVSGGTFRTDLYYRLNVLSFRIPPLRERPLDIEYLMYKFALEHSRTHGVRLQAIEPEFLQAIEKYQWPGNVREMENIIRRAVLYCQRGTLTAQDLPSNMLAATLNGYGNGHQSGPNLGPRPGAPVLAVTAPGPPWYATAGQHTARNPNEPHPRAMPAGHSAAVAEDPNCDPSGSSLEQRVDHLECKIIKDSLQRNNHRRKETAAELGISRVTLYNKMKKFGLL